MERATVLKALKPGCLTLSCHFDRRVNPPILSVVLVKILLRFIFLIFCLTFGLLLKCLPTVRKQLFNHISVEKHFWLTICLGNFSLLNRLHVQYHSLITDTIKLGKKYSTKGW